ncbi:MAG TPA: ABC transporter substrate-binding protein [Acidimicrobiales bacterium]|nr:ABC transporter substrate-binding protein [Acidimicrobiales bacterium]
MAVLLAFSLVAAACGGDDDDDTAASGSEADSGSGGEGAALEGSLSLGYFPNVTHAPAILGVEDGYFEDALGPDVDLNLETFNAGTEAIEALFAGDIDATFVGPNPAINGFAQSDGDALRIVAGTTSGGASLVVADGIDSPEDLAGKTLATPSLGNTQDVALRAWLKEQGYETDSAGGGDVSITPQENADTLTTFQSGDIDGAWVPEPWATRLVLEGGGHVLVNEADLWPEGQFVTTHLVVATDYLDEHPDIVKALLTGLLDSIDAANDDAAAAQATVNDGIEAITTKRLDDETISGAWENLTFTPDPIASSLEKSKDDAVAADLLDDVDLDGIYDLTILNELLTERDQPEVEGL